MRLFLKIPGVILSSLLLLTGCTRGTSPSSRIRLSVGEAASLKAQNNVVQSSGPPAALMNLVVNITGDGISAPIYYQWQAYCSDAAGCSAPPSSIDLDVPRGSARLVQVLGMYSDGLTFRYGQAAQDFSAASVEVEISLAPIASVAAQAHVMGRLVGGGTGELQGHFQPPNGAPAMLILHRAIFAGWFDIVALSGTSFTYTYDNTPVLTDLSLDSALLTSAAPNFTRIHAPAFTRTNGTISVAEPEQDYILGFFGPAAPITCYPDQDSTILSADLGASATLLTYSGTAALSATQVTHRNGGVAASSNSICSSSATLFADHLSFNEQALRSGRKAVGGFKGPFRLDANFNPVTVSVGTNAGGLTGSDTLSWNLLPDTTTGALGIAGVSVLARDPARTDGIYAGSGVACSQRAGLGFVELRDVPMANGVTTGQATLLSSTLNNQIILCPYLSLAGINVYPDAGVELVSSAGTSTQSLVLTATGTDSGSTFANASNTQAENTCKAYSVGLVNSSSLAVAPQADTQVFFTMLPNLKLFTDSSCGTSANSITIPHGESTAPLFLSSGTASDFYRIGMRTGAAPAIVTGIKTIGTLPNSSFPIPATVSVGFEAPLIFGALQVSQCYSVIASTQTSTGRPATSVSAPSTYTLGVSGIEGSFYEGPFCQGTAASNMTSGSIPSHESIHTHSFKPSSAGVGATLTVVSSYGTASSAAFSVLGN